MAVDRALKAWHQKNMAKGGEVRMSDGGDPYQEMFTGTPPSDMDLDPLAQGLREAGGQFVENIREAVVDPAAFHKRALGNIARRLEEDPEGFAMDWTGGGLGGVIKQKGGQWLANQVEELLLPMEKKVPWTQSQLEEMPRVKQASEKDLAINKFVQGPMTRYIKNEMATPEDPLRKLADENYKRAEKQLEAAKRRVQKEFDRVEKLKAEGPRPGMPPGTFENAVEQQKGRAERMAAEVEEMFERQVENALPFRVPEQPGYRLEQAYGARQAKGFPAEGLAETKVGKEYETMTDTLMRPTTAGEIISPGYFLDPSFGRKTLERNPWLEKVSPDTPVYHPNTGSFPDYIRNVRHIVDELENAMNPDSGLPASLLLTPDQVASMGMEKAARHVVDINLWRAEQKAAADAVRAQKAAVVYKEYPESEKGLRWVELKVPEKVDLPDGYTLVADPSRDAQGNVIKTGYRLVSPENKIIGYGNTPEDATRNYFGRKELEDALKYEGEVMSHCVGRYCEDVESGASRIFSLRDAKGKPHATIEVTTPENMNYLSFWDSLTDAERANLTPKINRIAKQMAEDIKNRPEVAQYGKNAIEDVAWKESIESLPQFKDYIASPALQIEQIKGFNNRKPKDEYIPYIQDFVKGQKWSQIFDIENTDLVPLKPTILKNAQDRGINVDVAMELSGKPYITKQDFNRIANLLGGMNKYEKAAGGEVRMAAGGAVSAEVLGGGTGIPYKKGGKVKKVDTDLQAWYESKRVKDNRTHFVSAAAPSVPEVARPEKKMAEGGAVTDPYQSQQATQARRAQDINAYKEGKIGADELVKHFPGMTAAMVEAQVGERQMKEGGSVKNEGLPTITELMSGKKEPLKEPEIKELPQSPLQRLIGQLGKGTEWFGKTLGDPLEKLKETDPIKATAAEMFVTDPLQGIGTALQDWTGTPRDIPPKYTESGEKNEEGYQFTPSPFYGGKTLQTFKLDPRAIDVAGAAQVGVASIPKAARKALMPGESPLPVGLSTENVGKPITEVIKPLEGVANQIETPNFKNWFGDWQASPEMASKVVDAEGKPLAVYHGTARPDRIGERFRKSRATSGPMAFFTDDPDIASGYAKGKQDTSLAYENTNYESWFKKKEGRSTLNLDQVGARMSQQERQQVLDKLRRIGQDDQGNIVLGEGLVSDSTFDFMLKDPREAGGNPLKLAKQLWLESGTLYGREEDFSKILNLAGVKGFEQDFPTASYPAVYKTFLNIRNPLDTANIDEYTMAQLEYVAKRTRKSPQRGGADYWDKNTRDPKEWFKQLKEDYDAGQNSMVWTSIPDWVTKALKNIGYDGIKDSGGKFGGQGHTVWIPFEENQVKSATGNIGKFDPKKKSILKGAVAAPVGVMAQPEEEMAKGGQVKKDKALMAWAKEQKMAGGGIAKKAPEAAKAIGSFIQDAANRLKSKFADDAIKNNTKPIATEKAIENTVAKSAENIAKKNPKLSDEEIAKRAEREAAAKLKWERAEKPAMEKKFGELEKASFSDPLSKRQRNVSAVVEERIKKAEKFLSKPTEPWEPPPMERQAFDRSLIKDALEGFPGIEQTRFPRNVPPRADLSYIEEIYGDPRNRALIEKQIKRGLPLGGETFYASLYPVKVAGLERGTPAGKFEQFIYETAPASARNSILNEMAVGQFLRDMRARGLPLDKKTVEQEMAKFKEKYGIGLPLMPVHREGVKSVIEGPVNLREHVIADIPTNYKIPTYGTQKAGDFGKSMVLDVHEAAGQTLGSRYHPYFTKQGGFGPTEYGLAESKMLDIAEGMGLPGGMAQAGRWFGGGELTGLKSPRGDALDLLEKQAAYTLHGMGIKPTREVVRNYVLDMIDTGEGVLMPYFKSAPLPDVRTKKDGGLIKKKQKSGLSYLNKD